MTSRILIPVLCAAFALALGCTVRRTPLVINDLALSARVEVTYDDAEPLVVDIPPCGRERLSVRPLHVQQIEVTSSGQQLMLADAEKIQDTRSRLTHLHVDVKAWLIKDRGVWPLRREELRGYDDRGGCSP